MSQEIKQQYLDPQSQAEEGSSHKQVRQKQTIPSFLIKTYEILENPMLHHILTWNTSGHSFVLKDQVQLCNNVLPTFFKHKNYPSFLRQLNMYNFKKTRNEYGETEFNHKWFRRGGKGLLSHIRRRNQEEEEEEGQDAAIKNLDEIELFRKQQFELKTEINQIATLQKKLQSALAVILSQNELLHNESINLQKELVNIQKRNQQRFDSYGVILSEIISKLQTEQTTLETKSSLTDDRQNENKNEQIHNLLMMYAKDNNKREMEGFNQFDMVQRMQNVNVPQQIQQLMMNQYFSMFPQQIQKQQQQQLQLTYLNSPYMINSGLLNNQVNSYGMIPMSPYNMQSPYVQSQSSVPSSPYPGEVKNEQDQINQIYKNQDNQ